MTLSKALDKSKSTSAVNILLSIAFKIESFTKIFSVSVEKYFLLLLWWDDNRLFSSKYELSELNWSSTTFSQTLEATGRSERGRVFEACSWSPSFSRGSTSAFFHALGYVDVSREELIISVRGPRITGNASLMPA